MIEDGDSTLKVGFYCISHTVSQAQGQLHRRLVCPTEYTCSWWAGFDAAKHNWEKAVVRGCRLPTSLHLENINGRQGQRRPQTN